MNEAESPAKMVDNARVLLVEDDTQLLELSQQVLQLFGFTVCSLTDGRDALDWFREHYDSLDLVILDRRLPSIGGGALFRVMHQLHPNLPIILSSGFISQEDELQLLSEGIKAVLRKPVPIKVFERAVRAAMNLPAERAE